MTQVRALNRAMILEMERHWYWKEFWRETEQPLDYSRKKLEKENEQMNLKFTVVELQGWW